MMNKSKRKKVHEKYNFKCAYCGDLLEYEDMQVDHIFPKDRGGSNEINNLNPSCRTCNFYKSTFDIEEFRNQMKTLIQRLRKPFINRLAEKYGIIKINEFDGLFYFEKLTHKHENNG